jgi:hypothetical protein
MDDAKADFLKASSLGLNEGTSIKDLLYPK